MAVRGDWLPLSPAASATRFWRCILQRPDPLRTRPSGRCRSRTGAATRCSPPARAHGARATRAGAPGRGDARPFRRTSGARRSRAARGASCAPSWGWRAASRLWRGGSSAVPSSCADRWSIWRTLYCARTAPVPSGARCAARGPRRHRMMRFQRWNAFHGRRCNIWLHGMRSSRPGGCGRAGGGRGGGGCGGGGCRVGAVRLLAAHRHLVPVPLQQRVPPRQVEVVGDHLGAHLARRDLGHPAELLARLRRVA